MIATHHDEPVPGERSLYNLVKVSWRLADTLGYAAFSPDKQCSWEELTASCRMPSPRGSENRRKPPRPNLRFVWPPHRKL